MLRFLPLLLCFVCLACPLFAQSPQAVAYFQEAEQLFKANKSNEAIELLKRAIAESPNYQAAILKRAKYYESIKDYEKALADYSILLELVPTYIPYLLHRGELLQKAQNFDEAETDYLKAYQQDSLNSQVLYALGDLYREAELFQDALKYLNKGLAIEPKDFGLHYVRAWAYLESKEYEKALADIKICEAQQPEEEMLWRWKALCYLKQKKEDQAIELFNTQKKKKIQMKENDFLFWGMAYYEKQDYKNAIDILAYPQQAEHPELYYMAGKTYFKLKDNKNALIKLDSAIILLRNVYGQAGEFVAPVYYDRAIVRFAAGKAKEAKEDILEALYLTPELITQKNYEGEPVPLLGNALNIIKLPQYLADSVRLKGHQDRTEALIISGETNRAWAEIDKCNMLDSLHAKNAVLKAKVSLFIGKLEDAFMYLQKAENLDRGAHKVDIAYFRAIAHQEKGEFIEAKKQINIAITQSDKTDADFYSVLGSIEFESANNKGALEAVNEAIKKEPQNMDFYIERAVYQQALGNFEAAIKDCNKVLENKDETDNPEALYQRGMAYYELKKYKEALADFRKVERYNPTDEDLKAFIKELEEKK